MFQVPEGRPTFPQTAPPFQRCSLQRNSLDQGKTILFGQESLVLERERNLERGCACRKNVGKNRNAEHGRCYEVYRELTTNIGCLWSRIKSYGLSRSARTGSLIRCEAL